MTYLEIGHKAPAMAVADGNTRVVTIDYEHVTAAQELAQRAFDTHDATAVEKDLANAVLSLVDAVAEIAAGLHNGRVGVVNYPASGAHLE